MTNMAVARHQHILDAVRDGDAERARAIVVEHMQGAANNTTTTPIDIRQRIA